MIATDTTIEDVKVAVNHINITIVEREDIEEAIVHHHLRVIVGTDIITKGKDIKKEKKMFIRISREEIWTTILMGCFGTGSNG